MFMSVFDNVREEIEKEEAKEEIKEEVDKEPEEKPVERQVQVAEGDDILKRKIGEVVGVNTEETLKYGRDLELILEWAKKQPHDNSEDIIRAVERLINRVGTPYGENKIKRASRYAYLSMEGLKISKELEELSNDK